MLCSFLFRFCLDTRRSLSVGDIYDAYQEEEATPRVQRVMPSLAPQPQKRPVPTPRSDLEKTPVDLMGAPNEMAPPLPGGPQKNRKPGKKFVVMIFRKSAQTMYGLRSTGSIRTKRIFFGFWFYVMYGRLPGTEQSYCH